MSPHVFAPDNNHLGVLFKMMRRYRSRKSDRGTGSMVLVVFLVIVAANNLSRQAVQHILMVILLCVALIIIAIIFFKQWQKQRKLQKLCALEMVDIDVMDGLEFEKFVVKLMESKHYKRVRLTERYDYGIDILAVKDDVKWGVQVKRHRNIVKAEAVRQVVTALKHYKCQRAMVVTNSTFSRPAKILAETNDCILVDKDRLAEWIIDFQQGK